MKSKYYKTWEEYKAQHPEIENQEKTAAPKLQGYEEMLIAFIMFLGM
ncbi:hypothetical protein Tfer_2619 [Thermincola ferriacetica]|uniref:Uncharacterized protein n=1 Tax=Thermincola ferriacetica TaxID=281456 RepID=A0A0L6W1A0_9FIRM|nr:hypothetical protein [Thermincola ferriacetica]KNZ68849.1 hypothetical protein Tfer_2619 [Thermincola ferriacetica]